MKVLKLLDSRDFFKAARFVSNLREVGCREKRGSKIFFILNNYKEGISITVMEKSRRRFWGEVVFVFRHVKIEI